MNDQTEHAVPSREARLLSVGDPRIAGAAAAAPIVGTTGNDTLIGTEDADVIEALEGADGIQGRGGDDTIDGGAQWDTIDAGSGDDSVIGGYGSDTVTLGDGNDVFEDNGQNDRNGADTVDGGADDDTIVGGGGADVFRGGTGRDVISGGSEADVLRGEDGDDSIDGGSGDDSIYGGNQFDTIDAGAGDDYVEGGNGRDDVRLGDGNDIFRDNGQGGIYGLDTVDGGAGDDTIVGGGGDDTFLGGRGNDDISGGDGHDFIDGGQGRDVIDGGAGNDTILGGSWYDTIVGGAGDDDVDGGNGRDDVRLGDGDDIFRDNGQTGKNAHDTVDGGAGDDTILGGGGDDVFLGGDGLDDVSGGDGDDTIAGGAGDDVLAGGSGADVFVVRADDGRDVIRDFTPGEDLISFEGIDAIFAELTITDVGGDAVLALSGVEISLDGVAPAALAASDFLFPDATPRNTNPDAIVLPDRATVIDVAQYGVIADDGIDDTAAIQTMMDSVGRGTFFFADGIYDISGTIVLPSGQGTSVPSFMTLQGESEAGTIFKLADGLDHEGPIIGSQGDVAQAFNNRVRDMTFDIGTGNARADGLQFAGNNQSTIKDVTIRSGEGGQVGLDLVSQSELGPALIEDVTVEGFETGIATAFQGNSVTLEDIVLRGQDVGISSTDAHVAFLRGIDYEGPGTGIANRFVSHMVVTDSTFTSTDPGIENQAAITSVWSLYGRNLDTEGFDKAIDTFAQGFIGNEDTITEDVEEYIYFGDSERLRGGSYELFEGSSETGLGLEVRETPETVWNVNVGRWVDVRDFGAVEGQDASAAFQAAIDSGATTVYVPEGTWTLDGGVVLRGQVEQFLSTGGARLGEGTQLRIGDGTADQVVIEGFDNEGTLKEWDILHDSGRTVVMRDLTGLNYVAVADGAQGDVFIANIVAGQTIFRDQDVWARQLNVEGNSVAKGHEAKVVNDGGQVWIMGLKTEGAGTVVTTVDGGKTELLGSFHNGSVDVDLPRFITEDASFWTTVVDGATSAQGFELVRETRDGVTREGRMTSDNIRPDVYSAFDPAVIADRVIIVDNDEAVATGPWQSATSFPGNFLGDDFLFAEGGSDARIDYAATATVSGRYAVSLRFIEERGGQPSSGHADAVDVEFGMGDETFLFAGLDMKDSTERWQDLGIIDVAAGQEMFVRFGAGEADGNVIADAVHFERIVEEIGDEQFL